MWRITTDKIDTGCEGRGENAKLLDGIPEANRERFRLFDDDGNLYYEGEAYRLESGFEPLEWAMWFAGCTHIKYLENGKWQIL